MKSKIGLYPLVLAFVLAPALAMAKPDVRISVVAEKTVTVTKDGKKTRKTVEAKDISPDEIITYKIRFKNHGDEKATNVRVTNPIDQATAYIVDSARGKNSLITFSIDGGKTYQKAMLLKYKMKDRSGKSRVLKATPEQYTNVRWKIKEVLPDKGGEVQFQVRVK